MFSTNTALNICSTKQKCSACNVWIMLPLTQINNYVVKLGNYSALQSHNYAQFRSEVSLNILVISTLFEASYYLCLLSNKIV